MEEFLGATSHDSNRDTSNDLFFLVIGFDETLQKSQICFFSPAARCG